MKALRADQSKSKPTADPAPQLPASVPAKRFAYWGTAAGELTDHGRGGEQEKSKRIFFCVCVRPCIILFSL